MAHVLMKIPVTMTLTGPVLTAGSTHTGWGLDTSFYRDWQGNLALPGSLIRGKLREALENTCEIIGSPERTVNQWFGEESRDDHEKTESYAPRRGLLKVSDFTYTGENSGTTPHPLRTRIRIEPEIGVVEHGALFMSESPFAAGQETHWNGEIEFFVSSKKKDEYIRQIRQAFHFITTIGAEKTAGYGRLKKIAFGTSEEISPKEKCSDKEAPEGFRVSIIPREPLIIGGPRQTDNIFKSEKIIPGTVLKGSFAAGLNRIAGSEPGKDISEENQAVVKLYPQLAKHFTDIRFLHAVPGLNLFERPETIPLSVVSYAGKYEDIAFKDPEKIYANGSAPVSFQIDWKGEPENLPKQYKLPKLGYYPVTRTAIDDETLKADESRLYSFFMIKPLTYDGEKVYWNSEIRFPRELTSEEKAKLAAEITQAMPLALRYTGKRQQVVETLCDAIQQDKSSNQTDSHTFAVVLQTPAIMLHPQELMTKTDNLLFDGHEQLRKAYADYWKGMFKECAELKTFFASQELQGGYPGMRFMKEHYRPFYLTSKGSTFVFTVVSEKVWDILHEPRRTGLKLPKWAVADEWYGKASWKRCPFVPENGYGEIRILPRM